MTVIERSLSLRLNTLRAERDALRLQDELRRQELADTAAALAECRAREAKANPDPRPWWEKATEAEGGCPL